MIIPPKGYWKKVEAICRKYGILLVVDEVITGFGRLGSWFGFQHFGVKPDLVPMAKGLSSGYLPISAVGVSHEVVEVLRDMFRAVGTRARAIADGDGTAPEKLDRWIATIVAEAAARPWFPPLMLHELASGAPRFDADTVAMMNAVFGAVRDIILQGQREDCFRDVDPLLTHLTIMPPILIFFARQRLLAQRKGLPDLAAGAPRGTDEFVRHVQTCARAMLRKDL